MAEKKIYETPEMNILYLKIEASILQSSLDDWEENGIEDEA